VTAEIGLLRDRWFQKIGKSLICSTPTSAGNPTAAAGIQKALEEFAGNEE
jgi:hypothetical protein